MQDLKLFFEFLGSKFGKISRHEVFSGEKYEWRHDI
jgi:hypothetical protein